MASGQIIIILFLSSLLNPLKPSEGPFKCPKGPLKPSEDSFKRLEAGVRSWSRSRIAVVVLIEAVATGLSPPPPTPIIRAKWTHAAV